MSAIDRAACVGACGSAHDRTTKRSVRATLAWLERRRMDSSLAVRPTDLRGCEGWALVDGELRHRSGRYFQVTGTRVQEGPFAGWRRAMIRQHEVGLLGFVVITRTGDTGWLVQAKTEPGNVGGTQLAPTVQATRSNQERVHGGAPTWFLEEFTSRLRRDRVSPEVRSDVFGSEQGTRFLGKRNRNVIVAPDRGPELPPGGSWRWLGAATLRTLLAHDFTVNTDARSVIVTGPWSMLSNGSGPFARHRVGCSFGSQLRRSYEADAVTDHVVERLTELRTTARAQVREVPLDWRDVGSDAADGAPAAGDVAFVRVAVRDREVSRWCQPLLAARSTQACDLVAQERGGILRFLFRFSQEPGLRNLVELGPTAQTHVGRGHGVDEATAGATRLSLLQSDEGGRFLRTIVCYRVIEVPPDAHIEDADGVWLDLAQVEALASMSGVFTNEARSVISLLLSLA